jgi:hypothetical protein
MNFSRIPDCEAFEAALCDYVDGVLTAEQSAAFEHHASQCAGCAVYLADVREGFGALTSIPEVEPPPVLVAHLLHQIPQRSFGLMFGLKGWMARLFEPVLQPRVVMGAMMTVLSLAMMTRCAGVQARSLTASDLDPVKIWVAFDDRVHRTWDRTVKTYESMRVVYEIRSRIRDWREQQDEQDSAATEAAAAQALKNRQAVPRRSVVTPPQVTPQPQAVAPASSSQGNQGKETRPK